MPDAGDDKQNAKEITPPPNTAHSEKKKPKAVALLSGGLDSTLAVHMMLEQGIQVEALAVKTPFCDFDCGKGCGHRVQNVATALNIDLKTVYFGQEYLQMLKEPKHGYGSGMNPCIDCRGMMYTAAKKYMEQIGADFIVTGEVLFQRPMSQNNHALHIIEEETGLKGKVLRPLSAKCLTPTNAENTGLIRREDLYGISGRSRKVQLELAKKFDINEPANAAGGCLLTDPGFSRRIRDAFKFSDGLIPTLNDIELLKVGRHFRLSPEAKLIVGRNREENEVIGALLIREEDIFMEVIQYTGPSAILRLKRYNYETLKQAASIVARYSDAPKTSETYVKVTIGGSETKILARPINDEEIAVLRL
jgi:tRNA-uridine 2-sulfurtransferase